MGLFPRFFLRWSVVGCIDAHQRRVPGACVEGIRLEHQPQSGLDFSKKREDLALHFSFKTMLVLSNVVPLDIVFITTLEMFY